MKYVIPVVILAVCMVSGTLVSLAKIEDPGCANEFGVYPGEEAFLTRHLWEDPLINGDEPFDEIARRVDEWRTKAISDLEKLKNTHVMVPSICKALRDGMYSLNNGKSIDVLIPPPSGVYTKDDTLHVIVVPHDIVLSGKHQSVVSAQYNQEGRAIILQIDAVMTPVSLGCLAHEVGHYIMHRDRKFKLDDTGTAPWLTEEVEMHELEARILDGATEGKWNAFVDSLADQYQGSVTELFCSITDEDFHKLETTLGIEKCGANTASLITAQLRLQLLFNLTDRIQMKESRAMRKKQIYATVVGVKMK